MLLYFSNVNFYFILRRYLIVQHYLVFFFLVASGMALALRVFLFVLLLVMMLSVAMRMIYHQLPFLLLFYVSCVAPCKDVLFSDFYVIRKVKNGI